MTTTYTARATREGRWWAITVPDIDGITQARRLTDARQMAAELIAVTLDVPLAEVVIDLQVGTVGGIDVEAGLGAIHRARDEARRLDREASDLATELARGLAATGVPLRDVGLALGISHQRAHQLVNAKT